MKFAKRMKIILSHPLNLFILRIIIGSAFILASYTKILDVQHFKAVVTEYQILPDSLVPLTAVVLPWLEFICGVMLILNIHTQSNALIVITILFIFIYGLTNNLYRGLVHDCGCFDFLTQWFGIKEEISFSQIIRDLILMLLTLPLLFYNK